MAAACTCTYDTGLQPPTTIKSQTRTSPIHQGELHRDKPGIFGREGFAQDSECGWKVRTEMEKINN